jgi:hypothetical protein
MWGFAKQLYKKIFLSVISKLKVISRDDVQIAGDHCLVDEKPF